MMSMLAKPGVVLVCSFCFYTPLQVWQCMKGHWHVRDAHLLYDQYPVSYSS